MNRTLTIALAIILAALAPTEAMAYTGPGAGISALGSFLALLAAAAFAIVGFVWYPLKRLIKSMRKAPAATMDGAGK